MSNGIMLYGTVPPSVTVTAKAKKKRKKATKKAAKKKTTRRVKHKKASKRYTRRKAFKKGGINVNFTVHLQGRKGRKGRRRRNPLECGEENPRFHIPPRTGRGRAAKKKSWKITVTLADGTSMTHKGYKQTDAQMKREAWQLLSNGVKGHTVKEVTLDDGR